MKSSKDQLPDFTGSDIQQWFGGIMLVVLILFGDAIAVWLS